MGAWVETVGIDVLAKIAGVAPYVGAWVETYLIRQSHKIFLSHLTWVRGLKPGQGAERGVYRMSHLTWVRGLKLT